MKKYSYLFLFILIVWSRQLSGQEIIKLIERDQDKDKDKDSFVNMKNADINSELIIKLDKSNLLKKVSTSPGAGNLPPEADNLLHVLSGALQKKQEWIKGFADAVTAYKDGDRKGLTDFTNKRASIAADIQSLLRTDDKLSEYFEEDESLNVWVQLSNALNKRIKEVELNLLTSEQYSDIRIQMGGWLIHNNESSPLHFEGFDTNPLGEFYEVERWKFTPTEQQIKEFQDLQQLAKTDELHEADLADIIRSKYVTALIDKFKEHLDAGVENFKNKAEEIVGSLGVGIVKTDIQNIIANSKMLLDLVKEKIRFYSNLKNDSSASLTSIITTITKDVAEFNTAQKKLRELITKLKSDVAAAAAAVKNAVASLSSIIDEQLTNLKNDILGIEGFGDIIKAKPIADLALEFSDKVLSLSLKDIPDETSTDLRYSGFREPGDRVVLKLVITKGEKPGTKIFQETKDVTLYRILPHIETTVGVIFAHPLRTTSIEKDFQMSPYYNLLFKGIFGASKSWKRRSSLPNTILDMSFGLHLSSPDFDKDDVPELGVGIVVSTLKDYVQFGCAYNIFYGAPYLFFGIRMPMPDINIGSGGNSSAGSNK